MSSNNIFLLDFEFMVSRLGYGSPLPTGRFEPVFGTEREGCQVYRQIHSKEIANNDNLLLYR